MSVVVSMTVSVYVSVSASVAVSLSLSLCLCSLPNHILCPGVVMLCVRCIAAVCMAAYTHEKSADRHQEQEHTLNYLSLTQHRLPNRRSA